MTSVKCEAEYRQDACIHRLERVDPKIEHGFVGAVRCGAWLMRKNGVVVKPVVKPVISKLRDMRS